MIKRISGSFPSLTLHTSKWILQQGRKTVASVVPIG
jgi:hypothetical protein